MATRVHYERESPDSPLASIRLDDGKANAMQAEFFSELHCALDRAEAEPVSAVILSGRPGFFSGGLDLKVLPELGPTELREVTTAFAEAMHRVFLFPKPIVAAAAGHAIAGGMMLYLAADVRIAVDLPEPRYGLNEATTGIPLLGGTAGLCQSAIPRQHHTELILHGRLLDAAAIQTRGIIHELVKSPDLLLQRARARAEALGDLDLPAYRLNKRIVRGPYWEDATRAAAALADEAPTENVFGRIRR